jgi:hypothetical protein
MQGKPGQKIELVNIILDDKKNIIDSCRGEWEYSALHDALFYQYAILSFPPGQFECRVALRNLSTGKGAAGLAPVTITQEQQSGIILFSPLLLIPDKNSRFLKLVPEKSKTKESDGVSINQIYPFISNNCSPIIHQLEKQTTRILVVLVLECANKDLQQPEIELYGTFIDNATDKKGPLDFHVVASRKQGDAVVLLLGVDLPKLVPGEYSIAFRADDKGSSTQSRVVRSFEIW